MSLQNKSTDDVVRARIDAVLKEQWDEWCTRVSITPSQGLRWLIQMHLSDPSKLWEYLSAQEKDNGGEDDQTSS